MKQLAQIVCGLGCGVAVMACGANAAAPSSSTNVSGTWIGNETDRLGSAFLTWKVVQAGSSLSGTVVIQPLDPNDGSCGSCHKSKVGMLSGTVSSNTVTVTMFFPAGTSGDRTPACSIRLEISAAEPTSHGLTSAYSGVDPCEGTFQGTLTMVRKP